MGLVYSDAHTHTNPVYGMGATRIGERFRRVGGWFMALVSLPPYYYGFTEPGVESYRKMLELLVSEAEALRRTGLTVRVLAGFHPAEVDEYFRRGRNLKEVVGLAEEVFKLITDYHRRGFIDGIGEVGRQHYSTAPARLVASELIMIRAMETARDNDMFIHLHLEQGGWATVESIDYLSHVTGLPKDHVFLHHSTVNEALWACRRGFQCTIPSKYKTLKRVLLEGLYGILVESDHIDDPKRPGVSSYPWDIPLRINELVSEEVIDEETAYKIMVDNIVEAYNVSPP